MDTLLHDGFFNLGWHTLKPSVKFCRVPWGPVETYLFLSIVDDPSRRDKLVHNSQSDPKRVLIGFNIASVCINGNAVFPPLLLAVVFPVGQSLGGNRLRARQAQRYSGPLRRCIFG